MRSGRTLRMSARPSSPSDATCSSWPLPRSAVRTSFWIIGSSSQKTIVAMRPSLNAQDRGHRQRELEHRTLTDRTLHPGPATVHLDDLAGDRQAEPGALDVTRRARFEPRVSLEDLLDRVRWDPEAGVPHEHVHQLTLDPRGERDRAAAGGILHRVAQQVEQHLLDLVLVDLDERKVGI